MKLDVIDRYAMLPAGSRVLCAVSGGADSMCMLHLLKSMEREREITVLAAHFEHGLRGEESLRDCRFVELWCAERRIPCTVGHGDVRSFAERQGLGIEEAARKLRYEFLEKTADALACDRIATAHNADDNAETVLFNLTRGSGTDGLKGIPPVRGRIVRPLLEVTRAEIETYLREHSLDHVEDSSNAGDAYSRNLIRHRVTPVLKEINPAFTEAVRRSGELLQEDARCLDEMATAFLAENFLDGSCDAAALAALPKAVASRVIRRLCGDGLHFANVEAVLKLAEGSGLAYADVPGGRLRREQGRIWFAEEEYAVLPERELIPGQRTELPEAGLTVKTEISVMPQEIHNSFKTYYVKYESINGKLFCTSRKPGDRIRPQGRGCTKSLKSLFTESGMTQKERDLTPVIRDEHGVIAVYGMAFDESRAADPGEKVLRIDIDKSGR